jgi:hypothetical protein
MTNFRSIHRLTADLLSATNHHHRQRHPIWSWKNQWNRSCLLIPRMIRRMTGSSMESRLKKTIADYRRNRP